MSSQIPLHESLQTTTQSQNPLSSLHTSQESKKIKPYLGPAEKPNEEAAGKRVAAADSGRERLKRHRVEVSGRVRVPDMWGQENMLKGWIDCAAFDAPLVSSSILTARDSLAAEGRRANNAKLMRIQN